MPQYAPARNDTLHHRWKEGYMRHFSMKVCSLLALVCLLIPGSLLATGFPSFSEYPIGSFPMAITTGDFNGDGKLDLVAVSQCNPTPCLDSTIAVILGRGDGRFRFPILSTTAGFPEGAIVAADFNGDRKLDIAFISFQLWESTRSIAVVLGNGDGTFGSTTTYSVPLDTFRLLLGDVNSDGKPDLFAFHGGFLQTFLGKADGTFQPLPDAEAGFGECVLADVDHDGDLDLVGRSIQLGNGDGSFQGAQPVTNADYSCPAVADFNGDGNLDVVAPDTDTLSKINLYFGNGDGTFQAPVQRWTATPAANLQVADFNGDGRTDLLTIYGGIDIRLATGNAKYLAEAVGYLAENGLVLGDFNGDNRTDLILLRRSAPDKAVVIAALAEAGGTFSLPRNYSLAGRGAASIVSGDFNGDGMLDLIELATRTTTWEGGKLNRQLGNGDGTFKPLPAINTGGKWSHFASAADLNDDGKLDVLVVSGDSVNALLGKGDGTFQAPLNYPVQTRSAPAAMADFNSDGVLDVALSSRIWQPGTILLGNGDGTFRSGPDLPAHFDRLIAGDFNSDGKQDLVGTTSGVSGIMLGNGDGTFQPMSVLRTGPASPMFAADFNLDGKLDLVGVGTTVSGNAVASVYLGRGDGTFQPVKNSWIEGTASPRGAVAADFNLDGKPDLAVGLDSGKFVILLGDTAGGFQSRSFHLGGGGGMVAGDFDGNRTQDLAVITSEMTISISLNK